MKLNCKILFDFLTNNGVNFFAGVPDSLLKDFCAYITDHTNSRNHIIMANEGGAIAIAAGHYLATGKIPLVYLQNSGLGNAINPLLSLADKEVYGIPMILMIGWRGEPGIKDEPQHIKQGRIQNELLNTIDIPYEILDENIEDLESFVKEVITKAIRQNTPIAVVVRNNAFESYNLVKRENSYYSLTREHAIKSVLNCLTGDEIVVSTTGKASREVFEYRVANQQGHQNDFLTVGSMGHASQIALGIALSSNRRIICLDGDGAVIMHMGALAILGSSNVENILHIVINNGAHDSVGGQSTVGFKIDLIGVAKACGYKEVISVQNELEIQNALRELIEITGPTFLEIKTRKGARKDLGRPTKTPVENKISLMNTLVSG